MSVWRDVPGYEGFYQVSDDGQVKSLARTVPIYGGRSNRRHPERMMKPGLNSSTGYLRVVLSRDGRSETFYVHRLVALTFLADSHFPGAHALHGDGNPINNTVENLRWGTQLENAADMIAHGRHPRRNQTECKRGHAFTPENTYLHKRAGGGIQRICRICQFLRRPRLSAPDLTRLGGVRLTPLDRDICARGGTPAQAQSHRRRGEKPCENCRSAESRANAMRQRAARQRAIELTADRTKESA